MERVINSQNGKANAMINNFWSFDYIVKRFKEPKGTA
jgi:hypothetical protein